MKFLTFTILVLTALSRGEGVQEKRGVSAPQQAYAAQAPAALTYTKVQQLQQPLQKTVVAAAAPQPQFYAQPAAASAAYSFPTQQQYQYQPQPQAVAYAQPTLSKYSTAAVAAPASAPAGIAKVAPTVYRQPFSLANDVSSFTYSSPVVTYNNLGLLSQVVGKVASPPGHVQAKVAAAPAPAAYQAQVQQAPIAYAPAPVAQAKYAIPAQQQVQRVAAPGPQQYLTQAPQQAYVAAPQGQAYQAQAYTAQAAQSVPQSLYAQIPQYYNAAQQVKQVNAGVTYGQ